MAITIILKGFIYYFCFINIYSFIVMGYDKLKAKLKKYRITEKTLINLSLAGGSFGVLAAMIIFRHKIRTKKFFIGVPIIIIAQLIIYFNLAYYIDSILK